MNKPADTAGLIFLIVLFSTLLFYILLLMIWSIKDRIHRHTYDRLLVKDIEFKSLIDTRKTLYVKWDTAFKQECDKRLEIDDLLSPSVMDYLPEIERKDRERKAEILKTAWWEARMIASSLKHEYDTACNAVNTYCEKHKITLPLNY